MWPIVTLAGADVRGSMEVSSEGTLRVMVEVRERRLASNGCVCVKTVYLYSVFGSSNQSVRIPAGKGRGGCVRLGKAVGASVVVS